MFANAVSSAVERLYAAAPAGDDRGVVPRVAAVSAIPRLKPRADGEVEREAEVREERDRVHNRQALTRGVLAVFEASAFSDSLGPEPGAAAKGEGGDRPAPEATMPDPQLEEAILRFIHTVFRSLADTLPANGSTAEEGRAVASVDRAATPAESREALSARIENLAQRLAQTGPANQTLVPGAAASPDAPSSAGEQPAPTASPAQTAQPVQNAAAPQNPQDAALQKAYAEVVQALQANLGETGRQSQTTRAELVSMMQRLALAMHGAPPHDPGLPTRGGLLSARA